MKDHLPRKMALYILLYSSKNHQTRRAKHIFLLRTICDPTAHTASKIEAAELLLTAQDHKLI